MVYSLVVASVCLFAQSLIDHIFVLSALCNEINSYAVLNSSLNFSIQHSDIQKMKNTNLRHMKSANQLLPKANQNLNWLAKVLYA